MRRTSPSYHIFLLGDWLRSADNVDVGSVSRGAAPVNLTPLYLTLVVLGSIVAHFAAEFAAMGSDAQGLAFSPRHLYLAIVAAVCLCVVVVRLFALWRQSAGGRDLKRALHVGMDTLPLRGRGWRFYALTVGLQFAIGLITEIGEGCPFCAHDVAAGVIGALVCALLLAFALRAVARRLPAFAFAFTRLLRLDPVPSAARWLPRHVASRRESSFAWFSRRFNRPPPALQV